MSHEITITNGTAHALYVKRPAWHRLGEVFDTPPTRPEAMERAVLSYEVEVVPDFIRKETGDGDHYYVASQTGRKVLRTDTGGELGTVGTKYTALQNEDAFRVLDPLLDTGVATIDAAFSLRGGADAVMVVKFDLERFGPQAQEVLGGEVDPYGMIANNHNGRRGVLMQVLPYRVECANMLGMAEGRAAQDEKLGRAIVLRHTQSVEEAAVAAAEQLFHGIVKRYEVVARQYRTLKSAVLTEQEFKRAVLDLIAPDPRESPKFNPEAKLANVVLLRASMKRAELRRLWEEGDGHTGDHSGWEAYQGAVQAIDHNDELWPSRGGAWRAASLLDGQLGKMKDRVLNEILTIAR